MYKLLLGMIILSIQSTQLQGAEMGLDVRSSIAQSASIASNPEGTEVLRGHVVNAGIEGDGAVSAIVAQAVTLYDTKSYTKAKAKFEKIIRTVSNPQDKARASRYLASMYYAGKGIKKDYSKAKQFWEIVIKEPKAYKIDKGLALSRIGLLYYYSQGVTKNYARARTYFEKTITEGAGGFALGSASRFLGQIYYWGYGVTKDYGRARTYFEKTINTEGAGGFALGEARRFLGVIYYFGHGVIQDYARAREYFEATIETQGADDASLGAARKFLGDTC